MIALDAVAEWLTSSEDPKHLVDPPGWILRIPSSWHPFRFPAAAKLTPEHEGYLARGQVLRIDHLGRSALWPMTATGVPIEGFQHIITGAGGLAPVVLAEAVLATSLVGEPVDVDEPDVPRPHRPRFPVAIAYEVGLVDEAEHNRVVDDAHRATTRRIQSALNSAARHHGLDEADMRDLRNSANDPDRFAKLAADHYLEFWITPPNWTWAVDSIPEVLASPGSTSVAQLRLLGRQWCRQVRLVLEENMHTAWHHGLWRSPRDNTQSASFDLDDL